MASAANYSLFPVSRCGVHLMAISMWNNMKIMFEVAARTLNRPRRPRVRASRANGRNEAAASVPQMVAFCGEREQC